MITFDGESLQNSTHVTRFIKHDSLPVRTLATLKIARQDGVTIVSDIYDYKVIEVQGVIKAASQAALETAIDSFKELISRRQRELDIDYAGGTRRYIATAINPNDAIDRDHYHIGFAPFKIHFLVPSGMGIDPSQATNNFATITDWQYSNSITITGSHPAKPTITITLATAGTCNIVKFINTTTNKEIQVAKDTGNFSDGDIIIIDCEARKVTLNGINYAFTGVFPSFELGVNDFTINFYGDGVGADQSQTDSDSNDVILDDDDRISQGFKIPGDNVCSQIDIILYREDI